MTFVLEIASAGLALHFELDRNARIEGATSGAGQLREGIGRGG